MDTATSPYATQPTDKITQENLVKTETGYLYDDAAAVRLVVDDMERCDAYINVNSWAANWYLSDQLVQSPATATGQLGLGARASVPKFTLSNILDAIIPKMMGALFYEDPPFLLRPRPGTSQDIIRAKSALFAWQFDDMDFVVEVEQGFYEMGLLGTAIWKWGWLEEKRKQKKYKRTAQPETIETSVGYKATIHTEQSDEIEFEYEEIDVCRPWFKSCELPTVRVDPGCRRGNIQKAKYVIDSQYGTFDELEGLRGIEGYTIPPTDELKKWFFREQSASPDNQAMTIPESMRGWLQHSPPRNYRSTADPLANGLEIIERQDEKSIITVLRCGSDWICIRNEENPFGCTTYFSCNWRNLRDSFYGQGLGQLVGYEQIVEQGVTNLSLDLLGYGLNPTAVRRKGFNAPTQQIKWKQGGIIDVDDDVRTAFTFLEMPQAPPQAWQAIGQAKASAEESSGANQMTTMGAGAFGPKTTGMRSGTGAALVGQASASRLDGPVERFIRQVYKPWLYKMDQLNNERLPAKVLRQTLGETEAKELQIDHVEFRQANMEYEVLAGAHLGPKKEMAQFMVILEGIVTNPGLMQYAMESDQTFDFKEYINTICDLAGFKYVQDFFKPMSEEQKQRRQASSPAALAAMKGQQQAALQQQKFEQEEKLQSEKQLGRAADQSFRVMTERTMASEEQEGEPGNRGFGDLTQG
jgi:hypothetical protein